jgi:hypothetical protein
MRIVAPDFKLRFERNEISHWASRYSYPSEHLIETEVAPRAKTQGYFTRDDFLALCRWKAPRAERHYVQNKEADVRDVTKLALATKDERLRACVLMALHGINWPMASVMLHFAGRDRYPILDYRALWSLSVPQPSFYTFDFWWAYTEACRRLADETSVTMRVLDRALWQFSKEHQPPNTKPIPAASTSA